MTTTLTKLTGIGLVVAALTAVPALAQGMGEWDSNGDGMINQEEFNTLWDENGVYDSWDENGDGALGEDEFDTGIYESYDSNDNGNIEEEEFGDLNDDMGDGGFWDI